jgi:hypothetical protein
MWPVGMVGAGSHIGIHEDSDRFVPCRNFLVDGMATLAIQVQVVLRFVLVAAGRRAGGGRVVTHDHVVVQLVIRQLIDGGARGCRTRARGASGPRLAALLVGAPTTTAPTTPAAALITFVAAAALRRRWRGTSSRQLGIQVRVLGKNVLQLVDQRQRLIGRALANGLVAGCPRGRRDSIFIPAIILASPRTAALSFAALSFAALNIVALHFVAPTTTSPAATAATTPARALARVAIVTIPAGSTLAGGLPTGGLPIGGLPANMVPPAGSITSARCGRTIVTLAVAGRWRRGNRIVRVVERQVQVAVEIAIDVVIEDRTFIQFIVEHGGRLGRTGRAALAAALGATFSTTIGSALGQSKYVEVLIGLAEQVVQRHVGCWRR